MAYVLIRPQSHQPAPQQAPPDVPLYPLPYYNDAPLLGPEAEPPKTYSQWRGLVIAVVIILVVVAILYVLERYASKSLPAPEKRSGVKRASTQELARNLYGRLKKNKRANPTTLRSLEALSRKR